MFEEAPQTARRRMLVAAHRHNTMAMGKAPGPHINCEMRTIYNTQCLRHLGESGANIDGRLAAVRKPRDEYASYHTGERDSVSCSADIRDIIFNLLLDGVFYITYR